MTERDQSREVAPLERSIANRVGGALPRCFAAMRTDGGTTFVLRTEQKTWGAGFLATFRYLQDQAREDRPAGAGDPIVRIPLPRVPHGAGLPIEGHAGLEDVDPRMVGWGPEASSNPWEPGILAEARVGGLKGDAVTFTVHDRATVHIFRRRDSEGQVYWECRITARARELYADGINLWMVRWLGLFSWVLQGRWVTPTEAHAVGWTLTQWHVNSDFASLELNAQDCSRFCGYRKGTRHNKLETAEAFDQDNYFTQTLYFGRKNSDTFLRIYRKGDQLREAMRVDPSCSMYAPMWRAHGWQGEELTRVEFVLRKKGLQYVRPGTDELVYDFRDPALLLNPEAVKRIWSYVMTRRRLVCPQGPESRRTRSPMDPAWLSVVRCGLRHPPGPEIRQVPHKVRAMTQRERMAKTQKQALHAAIAWAAQHGAQLKTAREAGLVLEAMGRRWAEGGMPEEFDALPRTPNVKESGRYAAAAASFFAGEADALYQEFCEEVGTRLDPTRFLPHGRPPGPPSGADPPETNTT